MNEQKDSRRPSQRFRGHFISNDQKPLFLPRIESSTITSDRGYDIGAAGKKVSQAERPYLSVTLDDPSFPATIYARLIEGENGTLNLIWSRKGDFDF